MSMKNGVNKVFGIVEKIISFCSMTGIFVMSLVIFASAILRYGFNMSFDWSEEVSRVMFLWVCYFGMLLAFKDGQHVSMTLLIDNTKGWVNTLIKLLRDVATLAILVVITWGCWINFDTSVRVSPVLKLSWKIFCGPMLIASAGMILLQLRNMYMTFIKKIDVSAGGGSDPCS